MKSPTTDKTLGIHLDSNEGFADVRKKARDEYVERAKRRKKDKTVLVPEHKIGDVIVVSNGGWSRRGSPKLYHAVEIVDFDVRGRVNTIEYYGIIIKTTDTNKDRVGRLLLIDKGLFWAVRIEKIPVDKIKWVRERG